MLLMLFGFSMALALSTVADRLLVGALSAGYVGFSIDVALNPDLLLFTGGCSLVALLLFGVLPAWQTSDIDSAATLKAASRSVKGGGLTSRRLLISGQVALTMILVMGANVFIQSLQKLRQQNLGLETHGVLDAQLLPLPDRRVQKSDALAYFAGFLERARRLPGVEAASLASFSPLFTHPYKEDVRRLDLLDSPVVEAPAEFVTDGFLQTMRIALLTGNDFSLRTATASQKTAIVSESLAKRLFGKAAPLGRHIRFGSEPETRDLQIVGVAADARLEDPHGNDLSFVYLNLWQLPDRASWGNLQLRYSGAAGPLIVALRKTLQRDGRQYSRQIRGISDQFELSILRERMLAALGTSFGLLGLVLAALGLFGLLSFFVATRKGEIGIRMALGAQLPTICWLVVREACILAGTGILIGLPLCMASDRALAALVPDTAPAEFTTLAWTCFTLIMVAGLATLIPTYRVSTIDPVAALRVE
jgi:predicted permease